MASNFNTYIKQPVEIDNIRYAKKRQKATTDVHEYEMKNHDEEYEMSDFEHVGLGEKFATSLKENLPIIHQVEPDTEFVETCGSVLRRASYLATYMQNKKYIKPNDVILIASNSHANQTIATLSSLFCGATIAPIDKETCKSSSQTTISILQPNLAFCDPDCIDTVKETLKQLKLTCDVIDFQNDIHLFSKTLSKRAQFEPVTITNPKETCAFILPTQGTTGPIKLVRLSHFSILYQIRYVKEKILMDYRRIFSFFPPSYYMQVLLTCACFDYPITKILINAFIEKNICKYLHDLAIEAIILTPYFCQKLLKDPSVHEFNISTLKSICLGGSPLGNNLVTEVFNTLEHNIKLYLWYAVTEVGLISGLEINHFNLEEKNYVDCGLLYPAIRARVMDLNGKYPLPASGFGEIYVQTPSMMLGYLGDVKETFLEHGFFKTGDVGFYDVEGHLSVRGRRAEIYQKGGDFFCAIEMEDVISKNDYVKQVVVTTNKRKVVACVVLTEDVDNDFNEEILMEYIQSQASTELWPDEIVFFSEIPKTMIGKSMRNLVDQSISTMDFSLRKSILAFD